MPVLIPLISAGAAFFGAGMAVGAMGLVGITAIVTGVVIGAVIGAAVGAIGAAITGGDIGEGALWGAIGGAVAGGFAGFAAGATAVAETGAGFLSESEALAAQTAGGGEAAGGLLSSGVAQGALISTLGDSIAGYAGGEAAAGIAEEDRLAAEKANAEAFEQQMAQIETNHMNRMKEIGAQSDTSLALADKNNVASMNQLNTRIGADKDSALSVIKDRENEQTQFNNSILGTDADLFDRPMFNFNPSEDTAAFDSGFDEAAASSPNAEPLTPEEQLALEQATV